MTPADLFAVCDLLDGAEVRFWLGGGWGVDVLAGEQSREHRDVDLAVDAAHLTAALDVLSAAGYVAETDWLPVRVELVAPGDRRVDVHPVEFDRAGNGVQAGLDGAQFRYPAEDLVVGVLAGRSVPCISAALQRSFHTGYEARPVDVADRQVLDALQARVAQTGGMRVVVLSDTHSPRYWKGCPAAVARVLAGADLVLHAGDVCRPETLDELATFAPVLAVRGNNDGEDVAAWGAPEVLEVDLEGVAVAMLHDSGPAPGRGVRLRRRFPAADVVVFGHSHIPWDVVTDGQRAVNPGSPTDRRRQPHGTVGELVLGDGRVVSWRLLPVS